jgi:hypothetical protein
VLLPLLLSLKLLLGNPICITQNGTPCITPNCPFVPPKCSAEPHYLLRSVITKQGHIVLELIWHCSGWVEQGRRHASVIHGERAKVHGRMLTSLRWGLILIIAGRSSSCFRHQCVTRQAGHEHGLVSVSLLFVLNVQRNKRSFFILLSQLSPDWRESHPDFLIFCLLLPKFTFTHS